MDETNYRTKMVDLYWSEKKKDPSLSIRTFSGLHNLRYYTFRDWYRDPQYNRNWSSRNETRKEKPSITITLVRAGGISR